jgi:hypothetical protein
MLVIRDVAGENLEDPHADPVVFSFFRHADAAFFLFDPMRVKSIRQQLLGVVPEQRSVGGDPYDVLTNLVRIMRGGTGVATINTRGGPAGEVALEVGRPHQLQLGPARHDRQKDPCSPGP